MKFILKLKNTLEDLEAVWAPFVATPVTAQTLVTANTAVTSALDMRKRMVEQLDQELVYNRIAAKEVLNNFYILVVLFLGG